MSLFRTALNKIGTGLAIGIGFGIVIVAITWATSLYYEAQMEKSMNNTTENNECHSFKNCEDNAQLNIEITKDRITEEDFILLGKLSNSGNTKWTSVEVRAELFDAQGDFIEECEQTIDQTLQPGKEVNFKLNCTKCSKVNLEGYDSYKVFIIDARSW